MTTALEGGEESASCHGRFTQFSSTSSGLPAGSIVGALYHKLLTQSSAPEDGLNYRPKRVELIEIINKPLLLHLVGCLYY